MVWDEDDEFLANREGWGLFDCGEEDHPPTEMQRIDANDFGRQLEHDRDAWELVWRGALEGRDLHVRALAYLYKHSYGEFASIASYVNTSTDLRMAPAYDAVQSALLRDSGALDERGEA